MKTYLEFFGLKPSKKFRKYKVERSITLAASSAVLNTSELLEQSSNPRTVQGELTLRKIHTNGE